MKTNENKHTTESITRTLMMISIVLFISGIFTLLYRISRIYNVFAES